MIKLVTKSFRRFKKFLFQRNKKLRPKKNFLKYRILVVPEFTFERMSQSSTQRINESREELARSITQNSLNTFQRPGNPVSNNMDRVRTFLQETRNSESNLASLNQPEKQLHELSYETLTKQLYGLPVTIPEFLILNGLKVNFIPFSDINTIQIERYIIEPLLQPWAGPPSTQNRILTIFGKNGMTYLVKAKYDQTSNQIYPPV